MDRPSVSLVIIDYNEEKHRTYLQEIGGLEHSGFKHELVVIDGGSKTIREEESLNIQKATIM